MGVLAAFFEENLGRADCRSGVSRSLPWVAPTNGGVKVNVDGAFDKSLNSGGIGIIFRNEAGNIVDGFCGVVDAASAIMVEAWALRIAIGMMMDLGLHVAMVESDCAILVECVKYRKHGPWECEVLCADITSMLDSLPNFSLEAVSREANKAADWLAKKALRRMCPMDWVSKPPSSLILILLMDAGFDETGIG